jgi:putative transposase
MENHIGPRTSLSMGLFLPRTARASVGGVCSHVSNRGNGKAVIFHDRSDYGAFLDTISRAKARLPMRLLAYCLMPNHFHLVVLPFGDGDLGRWMHWLLTSHIQRHRNRYETTGRIWQGRFGSFPVQTDVHLLIVLRYVERNPVRAGLVESPEQWPWSSLRERLELTERGLLTTPQLELPRDWLRWVREPLTVKELGAVRKCSRRDRPYGDPAWTRGTAERLGLLSTMRPRGRPRLKVG